MADASAADAGDGGHQDAEPTDAEQEQAPLPPMPTQTFLIGYNEAWFGANFGSDYTTAYDLAYVQKILDGIVAGGGHLVRLWFWETPQGLTLAASPPLTEAVDPKFLANVGEVLTEARKRALWAYITLLDANTIVKIFEPYHTWGIDILTGNGGAREAFNDHALGPLCQVLDQHKDVVFGIDIVNEIQAATQNVVYADSWNGPRAFLAQEAQFIKSKIPWAKVTSSAGWPSDFIQQGAQWDIGKGFYSGLGLDFYDLHAYDDSGSYPGATAMCNRAAMDGVPVYLGEFGQKTETIDDTLQYVATGYFLNNSMGLCLKGAFAWRYDPQESWWAYMRADFTPRPAVQIMQTFGALP